MISKISQACPVKSERFQEGEDMSGCVKLCSWCRVQRNVTRLQRPRCAEEAGMTHSSSERGLPGVETRVPSAGRRDLLRDFPEGSESGQIFL